ncbi:hypothetical protein HYH03_009990 [Edaphochlamys debaryana]|uniref:Uncharacterized protein n=1 Tax=Edaphochlamys debaryana TaxID=47281 RepID=A0A836BXV9_9CHLO|nr:hypothetical protein HYH03_009990 [Edaphochlamys debaryana]|eukprot:KAG2491619.1 hypothetical protein HYH03_009990 [Edaphochlamys debaryana]
MPGGKKQKRPRQRPRPGASESADEIAPLLRQHLADPTWSAAGLEVFIAGHKPEDLSGPDLRSLIASAQDHVLVPLTSAALAQQLGRLPGFTHGIRRDAAPDGSGTLVRFDIAFPARLQTRLDALFGGTARTLSCPSPFGDAGTIAWALTDSAADRSRQWLLVSIPGAAFFSSEGVKQQLSLSLPGVEVLTVEAYTSYSWATTAEGVRHTDRWLVAVPATASLPAPLPAEAWSKRIRGGSMPLTLTVQPFDKSSHDRSKRSLQAQPAAAAASGGGGATDSAAASAAAATTAAGGGQGGSVASGVNAAGDTATAEPPAPHPPAAPVAPAAAVPCAEGAAAVPPAAAVAAAPAEAAPAEPAPATPTAETPTAPAAPAPAAVAPAAPAAAAPAVEAPAAHAAAAPAPVAAPSGATAGASPEAERPVSPTPDRRLRLPETLDEEAPPKRVCSRSPAGSNGDSPPDGMAVDGAGAEDEGGGWLRSSHDRSKRSLQAQPAAAAASGGGGATGSGGNRPPAGRGTRPARTAPRAAAAGGASAAAASAAAATTAAGGGQGGSVASGANAAGGPAAAGDTATAEPPAPHPPAAPVAPAAAVPCAEGAAAVPPAAAVAAAPAEAAPAEPAPATPTAETPTAPAAPAPAAVAPAAPAAAAPAVEAPAAHAAAAPAPVAAPSGATAGASPEAERPVSPTPDRRLRLPETLDEEAPPKRVCSRSPAGSNGDSPPDGMAVDGAGAEDEGGGWLRVGPRGRPLPHVGGRPAGGDPPPDP